MEFGVAGWSNLLPVHLPQPVFAEKYLHSHIVAVYCIFVLSPAEVGFALCPEDADHTAKGFAVMLFASEVDGVAVKIHSLTDFRLSHL